MEEEALWYKDAIIYEVHIKAFFDSDGDGIGDFRGLTKKLDYLQDLGVTAIWILPFYPSPLKDDGYDIANYVDVHPKYGTMRDFKTFLKEAHRKGLKVITELVINHTSDQHPWFKRARKARKGSTARNFYMWSDNPDKFSQARIIFPDFESSNWAWDAEAKAYYWHRFYSHQPDLNYDNPKVKEEVLRIISYWCKIGIDGLRLDAIPYLYAREGTNCENLPETHAFLKKLRAFIDARFKNRMLIAEANQWPEDAAHYFGKGDECHMAFHFPIMPRLFMSIQLEDCLPIIEIALQTPTIPNNSQWALFLRNHDELTLEMVTDRERDYMFRVYATDTTARINLGIRHRLAPLLKNDRRKIELMNALLFSLVGTPVLYYGDEIGMGDNIYLGDRDGVRTPMQWAPDRNAGFSTVNPQKLYLPPIIDPEYHYETVNVEAQQNNPFSLLWWTKQLIALRKRYLAFGRGSLHFAHLENRRVLAFYRKYQDQTLLIVANLSRFVQHAKIDLSEYIGSHLVELFSRATFPPITEEPLFLTIGSYGFYWFALESKKEEKLAASLKKGKEVFPTVKLREKAETIFAKPNCKTLEGLILSYLLRSGWFVRPGRSIERLILSSNFVYDNLHFLIINILYFTGEKESYFVVVQLLLEKEVAKLLQASPWQIIARLNKETLLCDVTPGKQTCLALIDIILNRKKLRCPRGVMAGQLVEKKSHLFVLKDELSVKRGEEVTDFPAGGGALKLFTRLDEMTHIDIEMRTFLKKNTSFRGFLPIVGQIEYQVLRKPKRSLAVLLGELPKQKHNAWDGAIEDASHYLEKLATRSEVISPAAMAPNKTFVAIAQGVLPKKMQMAIGAYLEVAKLLGTMTANYHQALASSIQDRKFSPEVFTPFYQRSLYQSLRHETIQGYALLRNFFSNAPKDVMKQMKWLLDQEVVLLNYYHTLIDTTFSIKRLRFHGNYVLENLLYTGKEFLIADFAGHPKRTMSERRLKRSPLRDVAFMLYSFFEASFTAVEKELARGIITEKTDTLYCWARGWAIWVGACFLRSYLRGVSKASFMPTSTKQTDYLISVFLFDRIFERLAIDVEQCPEHLPVSIEGLFHFMPIYLPTRKKESE